MPASSGERLLVGAANYPGWDQALPVGANLPSRRYCWEGGVFFLQVPSRVGESGPQFSRKFNFLFCFTPPHKKPGHKCLPFKPLTYMPTEAMHHLVLKLKKTVLVKISIWQEQ